MKATLKLEDGKEISIELTEEQIEAITPKKEYGRKQVCGDKYWFINDVGVVICSLDNYSIDDECRFNMGNYYKTLEEAQFALNRQVVITEINDRIDELNEGWVPDWKDSQQKKFFISYYHDGGGLFYAIIYLSNTSQTTFNYMKSKEIADRIISEFKNNLETYIFKVK